ncbi:MAG: hypothetical protein K2F64_02165 [Muribaculaceae bacterium]|nr:hypothetical protein [Muribaculaceae bacterium]
MKKDTKKRVNERGAESGKDLEKRRRLVESAATLSLILIAVALLMPFAMGLDRSMEMISSFKWVYGAGALIYTGVRCINLSSPGESLRMRRLRRLEFWAGVSFFIGAFFWFWNCQKYGVGEPGIVMAGPLAVMRDTILFSLAGAAIQLISSWMIAYRAKKEK